MSRSRVRIPLESDNTVVSGFTFLVTPLAAPRAPGPVAGRVAISLSGRFAGVQHAELTGGQKQAVRVPLDRRQGNPSCDYLDIAFDTDDPRSPCDVYESADSRRLG